MQRQLENWESEHAKNVNHMSSASLCRSFEKTRMIYINRSGQISRENTNCKRQQCVHRSSESCFDIAETNSAPPNCEIVRGPDADVYKGPEGKEHIVCNQGDGGKTSDSTEHDQRHDVEENTEE